MAIRRLCDVFPGIGQRQRALRPDVDPPMPKPKSPNQNRLLAALTAPEQERLFPQLELVQMALGKYMWLSWEPDSYSTLPSAI